MTRDECIQSAAAPLALAYVTALGLDGTSVHDAALAAHTPTGPSLDDLELRISAMRVKYLHEQAA